MHYQQRGNWDDWCSCPTLLANKLLGRNMASNGSVERRIRQAALIQQWRPWERSTGPRTFEGKATSSRNAYRGAVHPMLRELSRLLRDQREGIEQVIALSKRL